MEEQGAALLLVDLTDRRGGAPQRLEGPQEAAVGLVAPADIARAPPTGAAEGVETAVVADPGVGVGLDVIAGQLRQPGPGVEEAGLAGGDGGDGVAPLVGRTGEGGVEGGGGFGGRSGQDGLGQTRGERHRGVSHTGMLAHLPVSSPAVVATACLFCRIRDGEVPARMVLDEPEVLAFLDHRPLFPGHVLVIPRPHVETIGDLPEEAVGPLFTAGRRMAVAVEQAMAAEGTFLAINNKVSQSVPHLHLHVVPRRRRDGLRGFFWPRSRYPDEAAAEAAAAAVRDGLDHGVGRIAGAAAPAVIDRPQGGVAGAAAPCRRSNAVIPRKEAPTAADRPRGPTVPAERSAGPDVSLRARCVRRAAPVAWRATLRSWSCC